ncbi:MAG TPA: 2-isopropylmalate synthase LeuA2, partial [Fibrobacteria bacterium]|nr:2-isopropylmalate synthase LeuA2 [Fibrobacteria bacterium]
MPPGGDARQGRVDGTEAYEGENMTAPNANPVNGRRPFFYDVTLRDGNQALKQPWNVVEKEKVFRQLLKLGVQGIEVSYPGASDMDFEAARHLSSMAPKGIVIAGLARAVERDILRAWEAIQAAPDPRIHVFLATSPFAMENVLRMSPEKVKQKAVEAVTLCKQVMGGRGTVQYSAEHFGDCVENLDFVIEVFEAVIAAGADVINLPNTVERYRPKLFVDMVERVAKALPPRVTVAVHTHNDLGMATATTVESFFAGATQLECALNGLGERAGNTNLYEVACALANCSVDVPLAMGEIYETALLVSEWSGVAIYEKAPLVGTDVVAHRSGIHQDGAAKTKGMKKGAYRAIDSGLIGRKESDRLGFTSQSGKTAVFEIIRGLGLPITLEEAAGLQPLLKRKSEEDGRGELSEEEILKV